MACTSVPHMDIEVRHDHYQTDFLHILKVIRPEWQTEDVIFEGLSKDLDHGRVNTMIRCFKRGVPQDTMMLRIHNAELSAYLNHSVEAELVKHFHALDCGPRVLATFKTGFCYEFIPGTALGCQRLMEDPIWRLIAEEQAKMHCGTFESPPSFVKDGSVFLSQASMMIESFPESLSDPVQNERLKTALPTKETIKKEYHESMAHALSYDPDIVLGHNDPRAENIIWNPETAQAKFVDFEAVSYIYRPLTLSLQFVRFGGIPTNYDLLPNEEMQKKWLRVYLEKYFTLTGRQSGDVTDRDVTRLYVQVTKFKPIVLFLSAIGELACDSLKTLDNRALDPLGACIEAVKHYYEERDSIRAMQMPK